MCKATQFLAILWISLISVFLACKSSSVQSRQENSLRKSSWKEHERNERKMHKNVEKAYRLHLKHQSKPMRKQMKKDIRRMKRDKRRKSRKFSNFFPIQHAFFEC